MDRSADFELPSPKRIRLQAPEHQAAIDPATLADGIDDVNGTPLVQPHSPVKSPHVLAPELAVPAFPSDQKLLQLPGLGMLDEDPASSHLTLEEQSQPPSLSKAERSSSTVNVDDIEVEDRQKLQVNGRPNSAVNDERIIDIQTTLPTPSEIRVNGNGNATASATSEELVLEEEVPVVQGVTGSRSEPAEATIDWHSSGTVLDNRIWLGGYLVENATSKALDSHTARAGTSTDVLQNNDNDQSSDNGQEGLFSGTNLIAERSQKAISTEPTFDKDDEEAEFELDSSPLGSESSSDDSTDTSSSDDNDADDYEMLSPAEQARRLMAEDGGSDDDGKGKGRRAIAEVPRTLNEKPDEVVPKPNVAVTEHMKIEELGLVENTIENLALIKANTSGEYQVLESGSLLCLQDRSVIGVVSETLGRVQQPYYSVRFTNPTAIGEAGVEKGAKIFYVTQHSTAVFTQPLKAFKGSDASNLHDEEVGDDELEFSDDEAEAEHKRQIKQHRMAKRNSRDGQPDGFSRRPQQRPSGPGPHLDSGLHPVQEYPTKSAEAALNYDDVDGMIVENKEDEDGLYTPLTRPSNLHEILSGKAPPINNHGGRGNTNRGRGDGRGANRGRGDNRGRGGNRGMRDSERGGRQNRKDHGNHGGRGQAHGYPIPPTPQTNGFSPAQTNGLPPRPGPETIGYQQSTHQGNGFSHPPPQQSPIPPPVYRAQQHPQFHTHPGYPPQYPNAYNQSHFQQPPHQSYAPPLPQYNHSQYHQPQQSIPHQGYLQQFASRPDMSFASRPQYPPSIPPGAHVNPNLFRQQGQASSPQDWQQGYNPPPQQQHVASPAGNAGPPQPAPNAATLQELLRDLGKGGGQS